MATRMYWIERFSNGARLGIMARPRGEEWLLDEIEYLRKQNVLVLVSLLEKSEINELGLGKEAEASLVLKNWFPLLSRSFGKGSRREHPSLSIAGWVSAGRR